ncbi:MAG: Hsp20/alpha crystallin family protein [Alphaproteobacteria bacterium]|nr:Hsp20/alpha crystallin family protein [Alphaproteobacteria bacterium]
MTRSFLPSLFSNEKSDAPVFHSLHKEIDRVFDEFKGLVPRFDPERFPGFNGQIVPRLNLSETEDAVEITAELPGVGEDEVDVSVSSNVLTLKGEKSAKKEEKDKDYHVVERSYGSFARTIPLSFDINPDEVDAKFSNGVLTITIRKPPEIAAKTKKIAVSKDN